MGTFEEVLSSKRSLDAIRIDQRLRNIERTQTWTYKAIRTINGNGPGDTGDISAVTSLAVSGGLQRIGNITFIAGNNISITDNGNNTFSIAAGSGSVKTVTTNYNIVSGDGVILIDTTGGNVTVTLPDATTLSGKNYSIKRLSAGANTLTVATSASQTIDQGSTASLVVQYVSIQVVSDGSNWQVI